MSNRFDPDQDRHSVGPDLGPNCFQRFVSKRQQSLLAAKIVKRVIQEIKQEDEINIVISGHLSPLSCEYFVQKMSVDYVSCIYEL